MSEVELDGFLIRDANQLKPFAFKLTRDSQDADDLFQETVYRALANRSGYNAGTNLKAWMFTIMRNIFINEYRKKLRHRSVIDTGINEAAADNMSSVKNEAEGNLQLKE